MVAGGRPGRGLKHWILFVRSEGSEWVAFVTWICRECSCVVCDISPGGRARRGEWRLAGTCADIRAKLTRNALAVMKRFETMIYIEGFECNPCAI